MSQNPGPSGHTHPSTMGQPPAPEEQWQNSVRQDVRDRLIKKILNGLYPVSDYNSAMNNPQYSRQVQFIRRLLDFFRTCTSKDEYFAKLADRYQQIVKDLQRTSPGPVGMNPMVQLTLPPNQSSPGPQPPLDSDLSSSQSSLDALPSGPSLAATRDPLPSPNAGPDNLKSPILAQQTDFPVRQEGDGNRPAEVNPMEALSLDLGIPDEGTGLKDLMKELKAHMYTCNMCQQPVEKRYHCTECKDFDLCVSCYEKNGHEHTILRLGLDVDFPVEGAGPKDPKEALSRAIQYFIQVSVHAAQCRDRNCKSQGCAKMKRIMHHFGRCKQCSVCKQFLQLCLQHAKSCKSSNCPVPLCANLKKDLLDKQRQASYQESRFAARRMLAMRSAVPTASSSLSSSSNSNGGAAVQSPAPSTPPNPQLQGFTVDDCLNLYRKAITDNPTINLHIGKAMTIGPPRVGKTYLRYLLLGLPPPKNCYSTPVMKTAEIVHIYPSVRHSNEEIDLESSDEEDLAQRCGDRGCISTDFIGIRSEGDEWVLVNEVSAVQSLLKSLAETVELDASLGSNQEGTTDVQQQQGTEVVLVPTLPTSPTSTPRELYQLLQNPDVRNVEFPDAKILQFLDCGGQLAYYDILPVFTTIPSIYLHVFNLTKDLMECPVDQIWIEGDEEESYSQARSPLSAAQMITRSVIAINSLKNMKRKLPEKVLQSEPSEPTVMLVGTHLDKLEESYGAGPETTKKTTEVDSTLQEALKSECLEEMVIKNKKHSLPAMFFPVNNKLYVEDNAGQGSELSRRAIKCLKRKISDETNVRVKVPVKWYLYQLLEMSKSEKERMPVHRYKELYQSCQKELVVADVGEFHTMVTYFNALGLCVHLCGEDVEHTEESTCFVFTNPSYLFENISKLYQVQFLDEGRCQGGLLSLKRRGILTEKSLRDLQVDAVHLKQRDFMGVLVQLFIGAEIGGRNKDGSKKLFIPSVLMLPADDCVNALPSKPQQTLPQFTLTFAGTSFVPCGVFTGAVARLLSAKEWTISEKSISRIHIPFAVGTRDIVHLFDCTTHIRVEMAASDRKNTQGYRDIILDAVAESYCFLFHRKTDKDRQTASCRECRSNPLLALGLTCSTCKPEADHSAMLHVGNDQPQTVRCQEAHTDLSDSQKRLFQNMEHYAVIPQQHTPSVAGGVMTLPLCGGEQEATEPSVSGLKRPPAHEEAPPTKRRDVEERSALEAPHVQAIMEHAEQFLQKMSSKAIASSLQALGRIPESVEYHIKHSTCREDANAHLLTFLKEGATDEQVLGVFKFASEKTEYRSMSDFATIVLNQLQ